MAPETTIPQGKPSASTAAYEPRDASVPWIFGIVLFLICCGLLIQGALHGVLKHLVHSPPPTDPWPAQHRAGQSTAAPFPRLQVSPPVDLSQFRVREDEELTNYGWVNRSAGIVRVPIDRAMDLVLQKGLPSRTNGQSGLGPSPTQLIEQRSAQRTPSGGPP